MFFTFFREKMFPNFCFSRVWGGIKPQKVHFPPKSLGKIGNLSSVKHCLMSKIAYMSGARTATNSTRPNIWSRGTIWCTSRAETSSAKFVRKVSRHLKFWKCMQGFMDRTMSDTLTLARFVGESLHRRQTWSLIWEYTLVIDHSSVISVQDPSVKREI